eukprot:1451491-Karenia_brevis.AAC.1
MICAPYRDEADAFADDDDDDNAVTDELDERVCKMSILDAQCCNTCYQRCMTSQRLKSKQSGQPMILE